MTTKEEILKRAEECGMQGMLTDVITTTQELEAFYHAARKPLEEQLADLAAELEISDKLQRERLAEKDAEIERLKKPCQTPVPHEIVAQIERTDWTPEQALQFYADQRNFDIVEGRVRIIDNGAVASNALKHLTLDRLELKGDAELSELRQQLAAAQAREQQYREALENCRLLAARHRKEEWAAHVLRFCGDAGVIGSPIRNTDTTALEAMIQKAGEVVKKQCVYAINTQKNPAQTSYANGLVFDPANNMVDKCACAIRALPGVTLSDLKGAE